MASLLVGLILVAVSAILARESRSLLMGEGVSAHTKERICGMIQDDGDVNRVLHILSTYQSPREVLLMLIIAFKAGLDTAELNIAIDRIRDLVKKEFKLVRFVIIQPESIEHHELWNDDTHDIV